MAFSPNQVFPTMFKLSSNQVFPSVSVPSLLHSVWLGLHGQAGWKDCARRQWSAQSHDHGGRSTHTCNTVASLPAWRTDYTCHHSHRLNEPHVKSGVWNGLPRLAHSHARSLATRLLWIYCPVHTGVSGNERADRLTSTADITSGLQLGRAEVLRGLRNFLNMDTPEHHCTDRLKEAADIPPSKVENDLCSTRQTLFRRQPERRGGARMGLSKRYNAIFSWHWHWNCIQSYINVPHYVISLHSVLVKHSPLCSIIAVSPHQISPAVFSRCSQSLI